MGLQDRPQPITSARRSSVRNTAAPLSDAHSKLGRMPSGNFSHRASARASLVSVSTGHDGRVVHTAATTDAEESADFAAPSPTALRLRSLARSVRAVHTLGALKVRKKYIASSPLADGSMSDGVPRKLTSPSHPLTSRVVTLPTKEFSTEEMKFRLDPLEPAATQSNWNVHGVLDALGTSGSPTNTSTGVSTASQDTTARPSSTRSLLPPPTSAKTKWKTTATRTMANNNSTEPVPQSSKRRGSTASVSLNDQPFLNSNSGKSNSDAKDMANASSSSSTASSNPNIEARLCCARSLYKLSCQSGSELVIIQGGAIAQIAEASDVDHPLLHELCAATLANLTVDAAAIDAFVHHDGLAALLELSWSPSIVVKTMCLTALCRLSCRATHAAQMAKAKASIELLAMMSLPSEPLQMLAIRCLLNLIFFGHTFPDRILLGEPHAIQSELGVMTLTAQLATAPPTMPFAAEVLFNLGLHRASCSSALRGGGTEILHGLALQVSRAVEDHGSSSSSTSNLYNMQQQQQPTPRIPIATALALLRSIAQTLANFSSHVEFHATIAGPAMKTLALLLGGALRDLGNRFYGGLAEERVRLIAVPCSRALANLSSSEEVRRASGLTAELVSLVAKLFLVNRFKLFAGSSGGGAKGTEEQLASTAFALNSLRAVANVSFCEACAAQLMEFTDVLPRLTRIVLKTKEELARGDGEDDDVSDEDDDDEEEEGGDGYSDDECNDEEDNGGAERRGRRKRSSVGDAGHRRTSLSNVMGVYEQLKEDALTTVLNLAHQGAYAHELLKHVDGKQLAAAAEDAPIGSRLRYLYDVVLSNLLFETRLQQIVYGDLVVTALLDGFSFHASTSTEVSAFKAANVAFNDDPERFLAAIATIAGELQDTRNIERLVQLALSCVRPSPTQRRPLTCYAAGILYALARSAAQRGGDGSIYRHGTTTTSIYAPDTVLALVAVCESEPPSYCATAQTYCAATLYQICAAGHATPRVVQALIAASHANEETLSLLACAAAFAIISFSPEGRQQLVEARHLARALNRLGRTSQVECQQYAALAACNVASIQCVWSHDELQDFTVIALLRANSPQAKQIHAKTLANLLSHAKTRVKAVSDGVLYALMKLSQMMPSAATAAAPTQQPVVEETQDNKRALPSGSPSTQAKPVPVDPAAEVFHIGLQVLFNLSCEQQYHQALLGKGVIAYLAAAVVADKQTTTEASATAPLSTPTPKAPVPATTPQLAASVGVDSRRLALGIVCNLSTFDANHQELMNAQVLDVVRSYVDAHDVETRASAAMAVRNLSCRQPWVELLCERRTLQMLIAFTLCDHVVVRHFAIQALANCSQVADSLHLFGELHITRAVMAVLEAGRPSSSAPMKASNKPPALSATSALVESRDTNMAALKCLHNIAADDTLAQNLMEDLAVLRLLPVLEGSDLGNSEEACMLAATMLRVLASKQRCAEPLLKQRVVGFCALLHRKHPMHTGIAYECAAILMRLSTYQSIQTALTETQAIQVLVDTSMSPCACCDPRIRECAAIAIRNLSLCVAEPMAEFYDEDAFDIETFGGTRAIGKRRQPTTKRPLAMSEDGTISRLVERHLLVGVKYLQGEFHRFLPCETVVETGCPSLERVLVEACAALANLSTVKLFRVAMVRTGVIATLLRVFHQQHRHLVPPIVRSICSATLHRLALEEEATVDVSSILVPSLLEILELSDEELQQVRYECEKVSLPVRATPAICSSSDAVRSPPKPQSASPQRNTSSSLQAGATTKVSTDSDSDREMPPPLVATTICVQQSYREPKWTAFIVKSMLSSTSMVPPLEKQHVRPVGLPKLAFFDIDGANFLSSTAPPAPETASTASSTFAMEDSAAKRKGGYLLPVHTEKFAAYLAVCQQDGCENLASFSRDAWAPGPATSRPNTSLPSSRDHAAHDRESRLHSRKFDRHMRLSRRNYRRTNVLPVMSFM